MSLNARRARQLSESATPLLAPGEQVQFTSLVGVGSISVRAQVATSTLVAVVSGGTMIGALSPRPLYLVMTDRRLLFFDGNRGGRPGRLEMDLPRPYLSVSGTKKAMLGLTYVVHLAMAGQQQGLKVTFPVQNRSDGPRFVAALPAAY
ncbi:hypothetical protein GCM10010129_55560 [Streptomyces fumigatiscleroticus]|nr:hypothetical protein GCM10010129_55560 [Streptomyces fumigatiscleroticus]